MHADTSRAPDLTISVVVMLLTAIGLLLIYSASSPMAGSGGAFLGGYFKRSAIFSLVGFFAFLAASRVNPDHVRKLAYPGLVLAAALLVLVWTPFGHTANGASRWIKLGPLGFQPSEIAKFAVVVFLAHSLAKRGDKVRSFSYGFLPHVIIPGVPILLVLLEPDLGTAALLAALVFFLCFAGGVRVIHLAAASLPVALGGFAMIWFVPWRKARFFAFLDPWQHVQDSGFQLCQSLLAFGAGGPTGVGLGAGRQKLFYLPEAHTDFILSVWAEEVGLVGTLIVLLLAAALVVRGYWIAMAQEDPYRRLLATGITTWLGLQAALNALVVMGCMPTKGLPFPFLSYGGTGLVVTMAAAGMLAGLARRRTA